MLRSSHVLLALILAATSVSAQARPPREPSVLETILTSVIENETKKLENSLGASGRGSMAAAEAWLGAYTGPIALVGSARRTEQTLYVRVTRQNEGSLCVTMNLEWASTVCGLLPSAARMTYTWHGGSHRVVGSFTRDSEGTLRFTRTVWRQFPDGSSTVTSTDTGILYRQ